MNTLTLVEELRKEFGIYAATANGKLPSIKEMSARYGVSPVTAMKAVRQLEAESLVTSIRGKGVFLNRRADRPLRVGIVTMDYSNSGPGSEVAYGSYYSPAARKLREAGCEITRLLQEDISTSPAVTRKLLAPLDALVISFGCLDDFTIPLLLEWNRPVVVIQLETVLELPFHQVIPDLYGGFGKLAEFLAAQRVPGVRVIREQNNLTQCHRVECFLEAMRQHSAARSIPCRLFSAESGHSRNGWLGGQQFGRLLLEEEGWNRDLIFVPSDFIAFGMIDTLAMSRFRLGRDYRLASFDNLETDGFLPLEVPVLTSVNNPKREIGETAAGLLLDSAIRTSATVHICRVPCDLAIRRSLSPAVETSILP